MTEGDSDFDLRIILTHGLLSSDFFFFFFCWSSKTHVTQKEEGNRTKIKLFFLCLVWI